jgi:pimeloyl-ACP methyl ester carboxylesterase
VSDLRAWWAEGERLRLSFGGAERNVFRARIGSGPAMTLLHGFPSSSHDWAKAAPALAVHNTVLAPDFLGFGASEKPAEHRYSLHEQADLVEALWAAEGIEETVLVAHDYGVSVAQELLARAGEGSLGVELSQAHFMNGGLYPELHRP